MFERVVALTEHAWLQAPTVRVKCLLTMRAFGVKSETFREARNPMLRSKRSSQMRGDEPSVGTLTTFPLPFIGT